MALQRRFPVQTHSHSSDVPAVMIHIILRQLHSVNSKSFRDLFDETQYVCCYVRAFTLTLHHQWNLRWFIHVTNM